MSDLERITRARVDASADAIGSLVYFLSNHGGLTGEEIKAVATEIQLEAGFIIQKLSEDLPPQAVPQPSDE